MTRPNPIRDMACEITDTDNADRVRRRMADDLRQHARELLSELEHYPGCFCKSERACLESIHKVMHGVVEMIEAVDAQRPKGETNG